MQREVIVANRQQLKKLFLLNSTSCVLIVLTIRLQNNRNTLTNPSAVAALHIDYNSKRDMLYKQPQHTS